MEDIREDCHTIRKYINDYKTTEKQWPVPDDILGAADRVSRAFDYLGLLDRRGLVDSKLVDYFYSGTLVELWDGFLKKYVDEQSRGKTHLWELRQFYDRVKNVPDNHPANTGNKKWPRNPRRKPKKSVQRTNP